jgi:signal peptidase I
MNPELQKGDRVVVLKMSDPYSAISPGTAGTVQVKFLVIFYIMLIGIMVLDLI